MKTIIKSIVLFVLFTTVSCGKSDKNTTNTGEYKVKLKLAHIMPITHPNGLGAEEFKRLVYEKSGGTIEISIFPASQLGNEKELFDAVSIGALDFTILGFGEPAKRYQDIGILDAPFLAKDREHLVQILQSTVMAKVFNNITNYLDIQLLGAFYYGARYLTTGKWIVTNSATLQKLNIRVPDQKLYIDTLSAMNAVATPMAFSEVFLALQQGVIDGQENPLATIYANKFNEVQKYLIKTEHIMGANALYASSKTLSEMPEEARNIIFEAAKEASEWINQKAFAEEDRFLTELTNSGMIYIDNVDKNDFREKTQKIYNNFDQKLISEIRVDIESPQEDSDEKSY